jgi:streptomycin 6-kinase
MSRHRRPCDSGAGEVRAIGQGFAEQVAAVVDRWRVQLEERFPETPGTPGNFVAAARRADGTPCVLKISPLLKESRSEIAALATWRGEGAARLLESEPELGGMLLERIEPGTMLARMPGPDDDNATRIACGLLRRLWRSPELANGLIPLESWCAAYDRNRQVLSRGVAGFPAELFQRADALRAELLASTDRRVVLHGDLHHFNILRSDRSGWLAIDPKGLVGDRAFDVSQFLLNPRPVPARVNRRRLDLFCIELDLDPQRTRQWCLVHAVLNACWSFEDGESYTARVAYAEQTLQF